LNHFALAVTPGSPEEHVLTRLDGEREDPGNFLAPDEPLGQSGQYFFIQIGGHCWPPFFSFFEFERLASTSLGADPTLHSSQSCWSRIAQELFAPIHKFPDFLSKPD